MKNIIKKTTALLLILALAFCPFLGRFEAYAATQGVSVSGTSLYSQAFDVLELVNSERAAAGLAALKMDKALLDGAMQRAGELSVYFSHTRPDGKTCFTACSSARGENIAAGQSLAASVMNSWMSSEGHKNNILESGFTSIGVGCFVQNGHYFWVQLFGVGSATEVSEPSDKETIIHTQMDSTVFPVDYSFSLSVTDLSVGGAAEGKITLLETGYFHTVAEPSSATWSSSDKSVASVDSNGKVSAHKGGTAQISASVCGIVKTIKVTVSELRTYVRLGGDDRITTALEICSNGWKSSSSVILANGYGFADALAGVPLAHALNAPVLLTAGDKLENEVAAKIKALGTKTVYILGGTSAVSGSIEAALRLAGYGVTRLSGATRYETAAKIAEKLAAQSDTSDTIFFTCASNYPDALSISTVAALTGSPILYVETKGAINSATIEYMKKSGAYSAVIVGGATAVSSEVATSIQKHGFSIKRISGTDRYATSAAVCEQYTGLFSDGAVVFATGKNFPDALAGAALAAKLKIPVLLTDNTNVKAGAKTFLAEKDISKVYIIGGQSAVSDSIVNKHFS